MCKKITFEHLNKDTICIADSDEIANYLFDSYVLIIILKS